MSDLKPCPFCTAALVWSDTYSEYHHPVAKCILSGHKFKKGMIGQWNRRALPAVSAKHDFAQPEPRPKPFDCQCGAVGPCEASFCFAPQHIE